MLFTVFSEDILNLRIDDDDFDDDLTIRGFLRLVLQETWKESETRWLFGNSDWRCRIYVPLIKAKVVDGELDEWGYFVDFDSTEADNVISQLIDACFRRKEKLWIKCSATKLNL